MKPSKLSLALLVFPVLLICGSAQPASAEDAPNIPAPPAVKTLLENHCIICHSDTSSDFGRLDLSKWVQTPDGQMGFVQPYASGEQRPSHETFESVLKRITTTDPEWRMPLGYILQPDTELEPFKAWLQEQLAKPVSP